MVIFLLYLYICLLLHINEEIVYEAKVESIAMVMRKEV